MSGTPYFVRREIRHINYLKASSSALVKHLRPSGDRFHHVSIDGRRFRGWIGPSGIEIEGRGIIHLDQPPLITIASPGTPWAGEWVVCSSLSGHASIPLDGMSVGAIHALAYEFGICVRPEPHQLREWTSQGRKLFEPNWYTFYLSPAFSSLCEWAIRHPRKARRFDITSDNSPLFWRKSAIKGCVSPEHLSLWMNVQALSG